MDRVVNVLLVICVSHNFLTAGIPVSPSSVTTDPTIDLTAETTTTTTVIAPPAPLAAVQVRGGGKKVQDKRLYASTSAHEETVTNEVSEKSFEDLEFLCHHYYKDEFVVSAHVTEAGCQLECVFLTSSGLHGDGFFDTSVKKHHNINEGQSCDGENVSTGRAGMSATDGRSNTVMPDALRQP